MWVLFCERAVKGCVNTGKNEEMVRKYTVRQIGIWRTGLSTQEPAYQHHNTTNQEGNNTNPVA